MTEGLYLDHLSLQLEATVQNSIPKIQPLLDLGQIVRSRHASVSFRQYKTKAPEVQAMRIAAQPVYFRCAPVAWDIVVTHLATEDIKLLVVKFFVGPAFRIGKRMP